MILLKQNLQLYIFLQKYLHKTSDFGALLHIGPSVFYTKNARGPYVTYLIKLRFSIYYSMFLEKIVIRFS